MQRLLPTVVALLLAISSYAVAVETSEAAAPDHVAGLAGNTSQQRVAAIELAAVNDPTADLVIQALLDRALYVWRSPAGEELVVVAGDESEIDGETVVPLYHAYGREPIEASDGATPTVKRGDLKSVSVGRKVRKLGRELLRLHSAEAPARRGAAVYLGRQGDPALTRLLVDAQSVERHRWTRRAMEEAIQIIRHADADATVRVDAIGQLGALHSIYALTVFSETLERGTEPDPVIVSALEGATRRIERWQLLTRVIQTGWNGISLASILAIIAVGLAITFGLMKVINMAHGELMLIGAYATYLVQNVFRDTLPGPFFAAYPILAIPVAFVAAALFGLAIEGVIVRHLYGRPLDTLLATFGISLVIQQFVRHTFGAQNVAIASPGWLSGGWQVMAGVVLPYNRLFILLLSVFCMAGTYLVLLRSSAGLKIRAVMQNRDMSACLGIPTRKVDRWTFAFGSGLAGIAGCALSQLGNVGPDLGQTYIIDAFMVVVLGGVGKLAGTICGAFMIGGGNKILETLTMSPVAGKVLILIALILFLQKNPLGIFPDKGRHQQS